MFNKKVLTEQSVVTGFVPKILKFNKSDIKLNLLKNYTENNYQSFNEFNYHKDYLNIDYHQHITWIHDYIVDDYRLHYEKTLVQTDNFGIVIFPNESIDYHHQVNDYDIHNSNDISCVYVLEAEKESSSIIFEYEQGRERHAKWKEPLITNKFIIHNSELRHAYLKNKSTKPVFCLGWNFQII